MLMRSVASVGNVKIRQLGVHFFIPPLGNESKASKLH